MHSHEMVQFAVQRDVMRRLFIFPWRGRDKGLGDEGGFAPRGHDHAVFGAMGSVSAQFFPDFAVDARSDKDASARFGRQINQTGNAAGVIGFG